MQKKIQQQQQLASNWTSYIGYRFFYCGKMSKSVNRSEGFCIHENTKSKYHFQVPCAAWGRFPTI